MNINKWTLFSQIKVYIIYVLNVWCQMVFLLVGVSGWISLADNVPKRTKFLLKELLSRNKMSVLKKRSIIPKALKFPEFLHQIMFT